MKKIIIAFCLAITFLIIPATSMAINLGADGVHQAGKQAGFKKATETTFAETLGSIVAMVLSFVGIIFTALMVYAGYLWMTAQGDQTQIDKAKNMIQSAIIGLIITLSAYSISNFAVTKMVDRVSAPPAGGVIK
jgi:hypothetical protein